MNLSLVNLLISKSYVKSSLISKGTSVSMMNSHFSYFLSPIIDTFFSLDVVMKESTFKRFLNRPIGMNSMLQYSIFVGERYSVTARINSKTAQFFDCIFKDCISDVRGGAIYIENNELNFKILRSGFYHCLSTWPNGYSAGGLSIAAGCNSAIMKNTCFFNCSNTNDPPSYQVVAHAAYLNQSDINNTCEAFAGSNEVFSQWASFAGTTYFRYNNNNATKTYSLNAYGGGMVFSTLGVYDTIGLYCQIRDCIGNGLIGFAAIQASERRVKNWNFINNSVLSNVWIYIFPHIPISFTPVFIQCSFINNHDAQTISSSIVPKFSSCQINNLSPSNRIGEFIDGTVFNAGIGNTNALAFSPTDQCWGKGGFEESMTVMTNNPFNNNYPIIRYSFNMVVLIL